MVTNQRRILSVFIVSCIFCLSPFNVVEGKASLENQQTEKVSKTAFSEEEALDAYDITEWFASQEWCDGNIGMFGRSAKAPTFVRASPYNNT